MACHVLPVMFIFRIVIKPYESKAFIFNEDKLETLSVVLLYKKTPLSYFINRLPVLWYLSSDGFKVAVIVVKLNNWLLYKTSVL